MFDPGASPIEGRRILVTDGDQRAALAVVRSLGAAGAHVIVTSTFRASLAGASRHARKELTQPDPLSEPRRFVTRLAEIVGDEEIDVLVPITEAALRPILASVESSEPLQSVRLPFPSAATFARASDKQTLMALATHVGVPVPHQVVLQTPGTLGDGRDAWPPFPLVLKPTMSVAAGEGRQLSTTVRHVDGEAALRAALDDLPAEAFPLLVQQRIVGPGIGLFLLRWDGRVIARFAHRRIREKPPSGGVSVYRESIALPAEATAYAEDLLAALDWEGVAMVEFKQDAGTGVPYLMEINGRFWGSLQLAIDAGVDFPRLLAEAAYGRLPAETVEGRPGVRLRWLLGDLDHLLLRLRRSKAALSLGENAPGRWTALARFLVPWHPGERLEVCRPSDFRPFIRELRRWFASLGRSSASIRINRPREDADSGG